MDEISLKGMFSLALVKKERFTGSYRQMRYMLCAEDGKLKANVYPQPWCWEATPEDQRETAYFDLTNAGIDDAVRWLNRKYNEQWSEKQEKN